jgi:hypothetical protein
MPDNESSSERYQRLAHECLAILPTVSSLAARATLIEMAQVWQRLANEYKE